MLSASFGANTLSNLQAFFKCNRDLNFSANATIIYDTRYADDAYTTNVSFNGPSTALAYAFRFPGTSLRLTEFMKPMEFEMLSTLVTSDVIK